MGGLGGPVRCGGCLIRPRKWCCATGECYKPVVVELTTAEMEKRLYKNVCRNIVALVVPATVRVVRPFELLSSSRYTSPATWSTNAGEPQLINNLRARRAGRAGSGYHMIEDKNRGMVSTFTLRGEYIKKFCCTCRYSYPLAEKQSMGWIDEIYGHLGRGIGDSG